MIQIQKCSNLVWGGFFAMPIFNMIDSVLAKKLHFKPTKVLIRYGTRISYVGKLATKANYQARFITYDFQSRPESKVSYSPSWSITYRLSISDMQPWWRCETAPDFSYIFDNVSGNYYPFLWRPSGILWRICFSSYRMLCETLQDFYLNFFYDITKKKFINIHWGEITN